MSRRSFEPLKNLVENVTVTPEYDFAVEWLNAADFLPGEWLKIWWLDFSLHREDEPWEFSTVSRFKIKRWISPTSFVASYRFTTKVVRIQWNLDNVVTTVNPNNQWVVEFSDNMLGFLGFPSQRDSEDPRMQIVYARAVSRIKIQRWCIACLYGPGGSLYYRFLERYNQNFALLSREIAAGQTEE